MKFRIFIVFFFPVAAVPQSPSPGGVGNTNLTFWLKADAGITESGGNVLQWNDQSNSAFHVSQTLVTKRPRFSVDTMNYHPAIYFDGNDILFRELGPGSHSVILTVQNGFNKQTTGSIFTVASSRRREYANFFSQFPSPGCGDYIFSSDVSSGKLRVGGRSRPVGVMELADYTVPFLASAVEAPGTSNAAHYLNGGNEVIVSNVNGKACDTIQTVRIGSGLNGTVAEAIAFNVKLNDTERRKVESYLALKYGITLDNTNGSGNYLSTIGDTLWNAAESGSYHNQVIAIGRDDNTALLQKQSHTADDATRIYLATLQNSNDANTGSFENDGEFLMAGNNNGSLAFASSAEQPSGVPIQSRMGREWKLTNTNFAGAFSIDITPSAGSYDTNLLRVLVDDDGDFTNAAVYTSASISYAAGVITVSNISNSLLNINTTRYITLAIFSNTPVAPGGIAPNLQLWLKANDGVMFNGSPSTDGGNVSLWQDKSGARFRNATDTLLVVEAPFAPATNLVVPPTFKSNTTDNINYNPVVEFDGENDALDLRNDYIFSSGVGKENGMTWLAVLRPKVDNSRTRQFVFDFGGFDESGYGMIYGASAYGVYTPFFADGYTDLDQPHGFSDQPVLTNFTIPLNTQTNVNQTFTINGKETATEEDVSGLTGLTNLEVNASVSHDNSSARSGQSFGPFTIGRQSKVDELAEDGGRLYFGSIAELIGYNKVLTDEERNKVETYLAVKYGITLDNAGNGSRGDYVSSGGSILWDASASIGFHRQIIGIGRDDSSTLLQRKSHTMDDTTRIYVPSLSPRSLESDGSFSNDRSFVLMGNDGGQMFNAGDTDFPPEVQSRLNRIWEVDNSGFSDAFSIDFILNTEPDQLTNASDLRLLVSTTDDFTNAAVYGENITIDGNVVTVSGIDVDKIPQGSTRFVTLGSLRSLTSLPVSLISFTAQVKDTVVQLDWATAWERNNAYFVIERSANGVSWQPIGRVPASDALTSPAYYSYTDAQPLEGTAYYRLKQTDVDGTYAYSLVRMVKMQRAAGVQIFPNPVTSELTIKGRKADLQNLQVLDVGGKNHTTQLPIRIGETQTVIDMSRLAHGVYFIKINNKTYKVLKSK